MRNGGGSQAWTNGIGRSRSSIEKAQSSFGLCRFTLLVKQPFSRHRLLAARLRDVPDERAVSRRAGPQALAIDKVLLLVERDRRPLCPAGEPGLVIEGSLLQVFLLFPFCLRSQPTTHAVDEVGLQHIEADRATGLRREARPCRVSADGGSLLFGRHPGRAGSLGRAQLPATGRCPGALRCPATEAIGRQRRVERAVAA